MSLRERKDREGMNVKRGRPLGPISRVGSFSSLVRHHARACASETIASTLADAASSFGGSGGEVPHPSLPFLPLVVVVDLAFFTKQFRAKEKKY